MNTFIWAQVAFDIAHTAATLVSPTPSQDLVLPDRIGVDLNFSFLPSQLTHMRFPLLSCALLIAGATPLAAQTLDTFETYVVAFGGAELTGSTSMDDTTVTGTGQGPSLVADGCTYSSFPSTNDLQWNGDTYYGLNTKTLLSNSNTLKLVYDNPVSSLSFTMQSFDGFGESVTVGLYDAAGLVISITTGIAVPDSTPVPFTYSGAAVARVELTSTVNSWSPIIDDHAYSNGLTYAITGLVGGGTATLAVTNASPGGAVLIGYSLTGAGPTMTPFGLVDMSAPITQLPTLTADAQGFASLTTGVPSRASGFTLYTQGADLTTGVLTNSLAEFIL